MQDLKISLIVPVYNTENFLSVCLDSLLVQSHRNLEILLVNDGSSDNSPALCRRYAEKDDRIIFLDLPHQGVSSARNAALDLVTGDYVGFVDSDDLTDPLLFEQLLQAVLAADAELAECAYKRVGEDGQSVQVFPLEAAELEGCETISRHFAAKYNSYYVCWNKLYRADLLKNLRFPPLRYSEDYFFNTQVHAICRKKVSIENPAYIYVVHPQSTTKSPFNEAKLDIIKAGQAVFDFHDRLMPELRCYAARYIAAHALYLYEKLEQSEYAGHGSYGNYLIENFNRYFDFIKEKLPEMEPSKKRRFLFRLFRFSPPLYLRLKKLSRRG